MALNIPPSLPPKKLTSKQKINEDEFEKILNIIEDEDIGVVGGQIDETKELANAKEYAINKEQVSGDTEDSLFDQARDRVLEGNVKYDLERYILKQGEDLRQAAYNIYKDANAWTLLAAVNNITDPSSIREVYPGKELIVIK